MREYIANTNFLFRTFPTVDLMSAESQAIIIEKLRLEVSPMSDLATEPSIYKGRVWLKMKTVLFFLLKYWVIKRKWSSNLNSRNSPRFKKHPSFRIMSYAKYLGFFRHKAEAAPYARSLFPTRIPRRITTRIPTPPVRLWMANSKKPSHSPRLPHAAPQG